MNHYVTIKKVNVVNLGASRYASIVFARVTVI
jgi:hypothetical protein